MANRSVHRMIGVLTAALILLLGAACQAPGPAVYYVDGATGDDNNSGRAPDKAWKSLTNVNATVFGPGEKILFRAGTEYAGRLNPQGSGSDTSPIIIDRYGDSGKPLIAAGGKFGAALLLENQEYWEINNLELTNTGPSEETQRYGVHLRSWNFGDMRHIHLKNLFIHDVNGSLVKNDSEEGNGILWENGGEDVPSRFVDLLIEDCHLLRTDRNGISGFARIPNGRGERWHPSLDVVIRGNLLEDIGGDGIKPWGADGALVEHNVVRGARERCLDYAAGIWPWNCDNTVIQFNEVSGVKGFKDGQAFDSDAYCHNTVFQYNYSHDNDGGFMLICGRENTNTVIRYNISQNDRTRLFHFYDHIEGVKIYNNVFYGGKDIDVHLFMWTPGASGWAEDTLVANNVFYIEGTGRNSRGLRKKEQDDGRWISEPGFGGAERVTFENNVLYGKYQDLPAGWQVTREDPMLTAIGTGGDGFDSVKGYQLKPESPLLKAGTPVDNNGGRDFWGNAVPAGGAPSIGVHEP